MPPRAASMAVDRATARRRAPLGRSASEGRPEPTFLSREEARKGGEESRRSRCTDKACRRQTCHEGEAGAAFASARKEPGQDRDAGFPASHDRHRKRYPRPPWLGRPGSPLALDQLPARRQDGRTGPAAVPAGAANRDHYDAEPQRAAERPCPISWMSIFIRRAHGEPGSRANWPMQLRTKRPSGPSLRPGHPGTWDRVRPESRSRTRAALHPNAFNQVARHL